MKTIKQTMEKVTPINRMRVIAHSVLNQLEQKLNYAFDFAPHKVEYYKECIRQHKNSFSKYLK